MPINKAKVVSAGTISVKILFAFHEMRSLYVFVRKKWWTFEEISMLRLFRNHTIYQLLHMTY